MKLGRAKLLRWGSVSVTLLMTLLIFSYQNCGSQDRDSVGKPLAVALPANASDGSRSTGVIDLESALVTIVWKSDSLPDLEVASIEAKVTGPDLQDPVSFNWQASSPTTEAPQAINLGVMKGSARKIDLRITGTDVIKKLPRIYEGSFTIAPLGSDASVEINVVETTAP